MEKTIVLHIDNNSAGFDIHIFVDGKHFKTLARHIKTEEELWRIADAFVCGAAIGQGYLDKSAKADRDTFTLFHVETEK